MLKDHLIVFGTTIVIIGLILGMFVGGMEEESILENKRLATFESPTLSGFLETTYQSEFEEALGDRPLFALRICSVFN